MHYEYDTTGDLSSLVVLTFLLVLLVPTTYRAIRPRKARNVTKTPFPLHVDDDNTVNEITSKRQAQKSLVKNFSLTYTFLVLGWATVAYLGIKIANTKNETKYWNPYEILGIQESATEKDIKKHYKKLSIKFHPDKVRLAINQTLEDVQEQFVGLTKAYKALTDDEVRQNFLDYGHPDGKQDLSVGIALPSWMVEGGHSLWVLAGYCIVLLVGLPVLVGRWWYKSASITKEGLLNTTAERFFRGIEDDLTKNQLISLLCKASEFGPILASSEELTELSTKIKQISGEEIPPDVKNSTEILLRAHLCRLPLSNPLLITAQQNILDKIIVLHRGLLNTLLAYGYFQSVLHLMELSPCLVQAIHPGQSPILQLPYITKERLQMFRSTFGNLSLSEFINLEDSRRRKALALDDQQYDRVVKVANALPTLDIPKVEFQVAGDRDVTPNAIVQLVFKIRRNEGDAVKQSELADEEVDEGNVDAILNADQKAALTAVPDTLSWAPYFPSPPKNTFWILMADIKNDRVIVGPLNGEDIGEKVRTFKLQFQAPPTQGVYTFQGHVKSDTYMGLDQSFNLQLNVVESVDAGKQEDEISEPDEDTIAGQMAAMKGAPVKRGHEYDTSSDEDLTDTDTDSDSDSD